MTPRPTSPLPVPPLLVITDRVLAGSGTDSGGDSKIETVLAGALAGGCRWIMLRNKAMGASERITATRRLKALAEPFGAKLVVNGDLEAAVHADGVHLPQGQPCADARAVLGPERLVGVSTHNEAEIAAAAEAGADYATISPVFPTPSKPGYGPALGETALAALISKTTLPLVALGGVTLETAPACRHAGAAGIAVMGTVMGAKDPAATTARILDAWAVRGDPAGQPHAATE